MIPRIPAVALRFRMADFKKLKIWAKAHALSLTVDRAATRMRGSHRASLRSQMVRAASSIPTNIVEGREQPTEKGFIVYLHHALGSTSELEYHVIYARDTGAMPLAVTTALLSQIEEVRRMLHGLIKRLRAA
jgi:four helix bundle protein